MTGSHVQHVELEEDGNKPAWRFWVRLLFLVILAGSVLYLSLASVNILVLGTDDVDYAQHTDTIMLLHWRPLPRRLSMLSVPRDTQVVLPKRGMLKINAVYAYGNALNGRAYALAMTRSTIENLLGVKIHYVIHVRYTGFISLVDAMGGVPMVIAKQMRYTDQTGGIHIDLAPGYQLLDGRQALNYVRFRSDDEGDVGRMRRQQGFVKAFVSQLMGFTQLPRTVKAFYAFLHQIETDLNFSTAVFLALEMKSIAGYSWRQAILPGQTVYVQGVPYWQADPSGVKMLMANMGRPPQVQPTPVVTPPSTAEPDTTTELAEKTHEEAEPEAANELTPVPAATPVAVKKPVAKSTPMAITMTTEVFGKATPIQTPVVKAKVAATPVSTTLKATTGVRNRNVKVSWPKGAQPVIRILNGCGAPGVCKTLADKMVRQGVQISMKNVTNAANFNFATTLVRTNAKNLPWARGIAKMLGLKDMQVQLDKNNPTVTVIVGKDHETWSK